MSSYVVCLDLNEAKIYSLYPGEKHLDLVHRSEIRHHTHADREKHKSTDRYFQNISDHIKDAHEILILGPGLVKDKFSTYLVETFPHTLGRMVIGVETIDHPSDKQLIELIGNYYRQHDPAKYPVVSNS